MDKKLKARWIKALESGRYKQTKETLYAEGEGYCCLGVLCMQMGMRRRDIEDAGDLDAVYRRDGVMTERQQKTLIHMNDSKGKSFGEIAKWIRKHL